jgi:hypothetical protein
MERPKGVTVLACIYFFVAFSILISLIPSSGPPLPLRLLAQSVVYLIIGVTLGIALLRMKNWSRWLAIIFNVTRLLLAPYAVAVAHNSIALIQAGLGTLFALWVIWYLTRPHIKKAFQTG